MFENTICCVYSNGWMPPVAPRLSTSTFKLTLRRFCVPLHAVHIAPKLPHPRHMRLATATTSGKNGTGPRLPMRAQKHAAAICPSPNTYRYAGQRCVNDVPAGAPPDRPRSVAFGRHACRPAWSIYRHVPRSPVAHGGLHRPQAYGWQRSDAAYGDGVPPAHLAPVALTDGMDALARQTAAVLI